MIDNAYGSISLRACVSVLKLAGSYRQQSDWERRLTELEIATQIRTE